mgnify:CR=1 FL=1
MIEQVKKNIKEQLKQSNMTIQQLCKLMRKFLWGENQSLRK